jgi:hypothetical protein
MNADVGPEDASKVHAAMILRPQAASYHPLHWMEGLGRWYIELL